MGLSEINIFNWKVLNLLEICGKTTGRFLGHIYVMLAPLSLVQASIIEAKYVHVLPKPAIQLQWAQQISPFISIIIQHSNSVH